MHLVAERRATRCAYCHDRLRPGATLASCPGCGVELHAPCALDLDQACTTLGCRGPGFVTGVVPRPWWAGLADWTLSVLGFLLVISAVLAFGGAALLRVVQTLHGGLVPW
jgi:hypothetical protein